MGAAGVPGVDDLAVVDLDPGSELVRLAKAVLVAEKLQLAGSEPVGRRIVVRRHPSSKGSFGIPSIASDGIHVTAVTDFSTLMPTLLFIVFRQSLPTPRITSNPPGIPCNTSDTDASEGGYKLMKKLQILGAAAAASALTALAVLAGFADAQANVLPANTTPPSVSGTPRDGETLTADEGTWTGTDPITYAYQWQRCDGNGLNCANLAARPAGHTRSRPRT